jgi:hypothetical protein
MTKHLFKFLKISMFGLILILMANTGYAQLLQATATSGGQFTGKSTQISFTVGETSIQTMQGKTMMLTQGFQQPQLWVTAINEMKGLAFKIQAYPNPVTDFINLATDSDLPSGCTWQLTDMNSRSLNNGQIVGMNTEISFQQFVPAVYILQVIDKSKVLKVFKIIKK